MSLDVAFDVLLLCSLCLRPECSHGPSQRKVSKTCLKMSFSFAASAFDLSVPTAPPRPPRPTLPPAGGEESGEASAARPLGGEVAPAVGGESSAEEMEVSDADSDTGTVVPRGESTKKKIAPARHPLRRPRLDGGEPLAGAAEAGPAAETEEAPLVLMLRLLGSESEGLEMLH